VAIALDGSEVPDRAADGSLLVDDDFLVLVNGWREDVEFAMAPGVQEWASSSGPATPRRRAVRCAKPATSSPSGRSASSCCDPTPALP
jgi:hypothetical protein